jgi:hypothetical protein
MSVLDKPARAAVEPSPLEREWPRGTKVKLKLCPDAAPGEVRGTMGRRIIVHWEDIAYTGLHRPDALQRIEPVAEE